jgi:hypothetical protein
MRDQREQFGSNHHEIRVTGKEGKSTTDVTSTALGKKEMAVRL